MKALIKEDYENYTISNPGSIERLEHSESLIEGTNPKVDKWKMQSPQSCKEQQEVEEVRSDGDSDEITFLYSKTPEDPLDTNKNLTKPEKELNSRKRKTKSKISYDENFTDESDDDNLHLHLDSESDLENKSSNINKRKKYKESPVVSNFSSDSDIEIVKKKIHENENTTFVNLSEKRHLTNSEKEHVKKLKNSENVIHHSELGANHSHYVNNNKFRNDKVTDKDIHLKEFWEKTDVAEIFLSVKNEDMTMQTASEILGSSYSYTYQRYKEIVLNGTGTCDEGELNKPWFICKRYVRQYVNSSTEDPGKCSDNKGKTSYKNGNKLSNTSKSESMNNNMISEICSLPGWKHQVKVRKIGSTAGRTDVYYISPSGKKLRSKTSLISYCNEEGIDVNLSKFDFRKPKMRNKKTRKVIKYKTSDSELSEPESVQTKKSVENRLNDNLLLIRYNIRKCIRIILDDCMTSKTSLSPEIKKITMPHGINSVRKILSEASQEENISVGNENNDNIKSESTSFEDNYNTFQRREEEKNNLTSNGIEKALVKIEDDVKNYESQNATLSGYEEEKASGSNSMEIKTEDRPESQNATSSLSGYVEEKASGSNSIEIKTEDRPELGRLQSSSIVNDKTSEAYQINKDSNSDSGSQSELILSEVDNAGEGTTNISEELYKFSVGQGNKAVKGSRDVYKGETDGRKDYSASFHERPILKPEVVNTNTEKGSQNTKKACLFYSAIGTNINVHSIMQNENYGAMLSQSNDHYFHTEEPLLTTDILPNVIKTAGDRFPNLSPNSSNNDSRPSTDMTNSSRVTVNYGSVTINFTPFNIIDVNFKESLNLSEKEKHINIFKKANSKPIDESQHVVMANNMEEQRVKNYTEKEMDETKFQDGGNSSERERKLIIAFALDNFPCQEQLIILAEGLSMRVARVKRWFMNKRIALIESMILREEGDVIDKGMLNYKKHLLPYHCKKCKAAFVCLKDCRNHKKEHHWTNEDYTCKRCDKIFSSSAEYDEHKQNGQCEHKFTILDVVWAKFNVYPWWPAIVCKHPNTEAYLRRNQIHVQFFDKPVSRGWVDDKYVRAFGPVGKCGIPLCSDKKWVTSVIDAQRAVMMPKMTRSKLLATMTPSDDESDWRPEGEIKFSGKSSENENISERLYNSKIKRSDRTEDSKSFYRSKKKKSYQTESSDSGGSSPDPDYYIKRKKNRLKNKHLKKIRKREKEYEKIKCENAKSIESISRRKRMILDEHFTHDHMIPCDVQNDLAKELKLSQTTVTQYLRTFRTQIFTKVKRNNEERGVFSCNMCPVKYLAKSCLNNHMELHRPERGLKCSDCSTAFEHPSVYYHHLRFKGHNASREIDEYLKELSEHAISVKDLIRDLDYIFTDKYNQNCSKLDLNKIVDKVYELKCQPGEECQCEDEFSDSVPRYIQDMFQGMESNHDFIIVDHDDLIYMGKGNDDELVPMIIKNGAEMLAASDIPYKKFYYKFKPPTDLVPRKGPPEISKPALPNETSTEPKVTAEKTMSQVPTENTTQSVPSETVSQTIPIEPTILRVPSETISQAVPAEPTILRVPSETISQAVSAEPTIPLVPAETTLSVVNIVTTTLAVGPENITPAIVPFETTIPAISTETTKAILPNKTTSTFPAETTILTVPAETTKPAVVPVKTTTPPVLDMTTTPAVPSETTKPILPVNSTIPTSTTMLTVTSETKKPVLVPVEASKHILPTNTSTVPSEKTTSTVPTDMPIVPTQTTVSTMTNTFTESGETPTTLSAETMAAAGINRTSKPLLTRTNIATEPSTYLQQTIGNSSTPAQSHYRL